MTRLPTPLTTYPHHLDVKVLLDAAVLARPELVLRQLGDQLLDRLFYRPLLSLRQNGDRGAGRPGAGVWLGAGRGRRRRAVSRVPVRTLKRPPRYKKVKSIRVVVTMVAIVI